MRYFNFKHLVVTFFLTICFIYAQDTTLTVTSNGNAGIGTTNPQQKLHIVGSVQMDKLGANLGRLILKTPSLNDPGRYGILFSNNLLAPFLGDDIGNQVYGFYSIWGPNRTFDASISIYGKASGSWGNALRLTHNGSDGYITTDVGDIILNPVDGLANVGIGTVNPIAAFHVSSSGGYATPQALFQQTGADGFARLRLQNLANQTWDITGSSNNQLRFFTGSGNTDVLTLTANGYVGVGTLSPIDKFEVNGGAFTLDGAGELLAFRMRQSDSLRWTFLSAPWIGNDLRLRNEVTGVDMLVFDQATNNIGIRTNNPLGTLDVNGTIYQRGGQLHADYVFEPDYLLESIDDHADFMWENKHLAGIPKATYDKDGIEVVEVGSHRKGIVEELEKAHIYIDQLNNKLKLLEEKLDTLSALQIEKDK